MTSPRQLPAFDLNDGYRLPAIGLGTASLRGEAGIAAVVTALHSGYRLLDTAVGYRNEHDVGEGIRRSGIPADEITVATKINGRGLGYDEARRSIAQSRRELGVEQIGLHLIHWPMPELDRYVDTWRAMVAARADGEIRSIGVSNFTARYLDPVIDATGVVPAVNQVELHPHFPQAEQRQVDRERGIVTQAWSPLGRGRELLTDPAVAGPATRLGLTPGQVVLRWLYELGVAAVPRSADPDRQRQNLDLDGFELSVDQVEAISALGRRGGRLWGGDPDTTGFM